MRRPAALAIAAIALVSSVSGWPATTAPQAVLAQADACTTEVEPNDLPDGLPLTTDPWCMEGTLPAGDQDLVLWELRPGDTATAWTLTLDGIPGVLTALDVLPVISDPGVLPLGVGTSILRVEAAADAPRGYAPVEQVLLMPGRYVLGLSRALPADGVEPPETPYRLQVAPGEAPPERTEVEPNEDPTSATDLSGPFTVAADASGTVDVFAWTVDGTPDDGSWTLRLDGALGAGLALTVRDAAGTDVVTAYQDLHGRVVMPDLRLASGTWTLSVNGGGDRPIPYRLAAELEARAADAEPNDLVSGAVRADPVVAPVHGRLWPPNDRDRFRITIPADVSTTLRDLKVLGGGGLDRSLCIARADGQDLQCRQGSGGVALRSLALAPGEYVVTVAGDPDPDLGYVLRLDATSASLPDFELEPNDSPFVATPFTPGIVMRGLAADDDTDIYRLDVSGAPQLWQIQVEGSGISVLSWLRQDWTHLGTGWIEPDRTRATLTDLYLVPGQHWFRVQGGGDYRITATSLGPPDPDAEREPNDSPSFAQPYRLGREHLIGRLPFISDSDLLRFSLAGTERVAVVVEPPPDGSIDVSVTAGGEPMGRLRAGEPGVPARLDVLLGPGDYEIWLRPGQPSLGRYRLRLERQDPWPVTADQEPNDRIEMARDLPPSLTVTGSLPPGDGPDWFVLPPIAPGTAVIGSLTGGATDATVSDGVSDLPLTWTDDGLSFTADGSSGLVPRFLSVFGQGDYTVTVRASGLLPIPAPATPRVHADLVLDGGVVAAYWPAAQRLAGTLTLRNDGDAALELALEAVTSHHAWSVSLAVPSATLAPGEMRTVPVTVLAGPDAWADEPVRISVRASSGVGPALVGRVTASAFVTPRGDADPVAPELGWSVPTELLGGFDVASLALGATTIPSLDQVLEDSLHDGFTHTGTGFSTGRASLPIILTVDLAGDAPVPVAGFGLNPQADEAYLGDVPRDVELLLSTDGVTWSSVATARMTTLMADQWIVLPEPLPATHAQLRILSAHGAGFDQVILGEWKVIATPGTAVAEADGLDLARPDRGGHVAWMDPQPFDEGVGPSWLDPTIDADALYLDAGSSVSWAIGFRNGRAALLKQLDWADPVVSTEGSRFRAVEVEVSVDGPVGPWEPLGTWRLDRAADGTVTPFVFPEPTWARYLRFTGAGPTEVAGSWDPPGGIAAIEQPTDGNHRSLLAEWGTDATGPLEWLQPPDPSIPPVADDTDDTPETAAPLPADIVTAGRIDGRADVDWSTFTVPEGHNTMSLQVGGTPVVSVALTLVDRDGLEVPMLFRAGDRPGTVLYEAEVEPGETYHVKVEQPPASIVFTFDTSGSLGPYLDYIYQAMRAFTADVTPGQEFVSIVPFEEEPLLPDWSDDPFALQDAVGRFVSLGGSSSAETALIDATTALSAREGARAVLIVTDAETSSFQRATELWRILGSVRPLVFSVQVGAIGAPAVSSGYMRDWAGVAGGVYQYARTHGEMDRAFDRMATWLRRPAAYTLRLQTLFLEKPPPSAEPGSISVASPADGTVSLSPDVGVEIILDTSGSMLRELRGRPRIDLAKEVLADMVRDRLPRGAPVAVRVLGDAADVCGTRLVVPLGPLDPDAVIADVNAIQVVQEADTPLGQALRAVPDDLAGSTGTRIVLLITDSEEVWPHPDLCGENPAAAIRDLRRRGIDARLNIVGLQVDARRATRQLRTWARLGNGSFFSAKDANALERTIRTALSAPFRILDAQGNEVASGTVDGAGVPVPPGTYSVVVLTDPVTRFDGVEITPGGGQSLTLPDATPAPSLEPAVAPAP